MTQLMIVIFIGLSIGILLMRLMGRAKGKFDPVVLQIQDGHFEKAIEMAKEEIEKSPEKKHHVAQRHIDMAICYERMGEFEQSIRCLEECDLSYLKKPIHQTYDSMYALNLMLLRKKTDHAIRYVGKTQEFNRFRKQANLFYTNYLVMAHLDLDRKNLEGGEFLAAEVRRLRLTDVRNEVSDYAYRRIGADFRRIQEDYLLGWFYERVGDDEVAAMFYAPVADFRYDNYYTRKAKAFMETYDGVIQREPTLKQMTKEFRERRKQQRKDKKLDKAE